MDEQRRQPEVASCISGQAWANTIAALGLSRRESEIVSCMLAGIDDEAAIADRLGVSRHTVHTYLERLYRKLRVGTRCQALAAVFVAYAQIGVRPGSNSPASQHDAV